MDKHGLAIAEAVSERIPGVPILALTRYIKDDQLLTEVSVHPCVDGVLPKKYLESDEFARRDFLRLVGSASEKAKARACHRVGAPVVASDAQRDCDVAITCALVSPEFEEVRKLAQWDQVSKSGDATQYFLSKWPSKNGSAIKVVAAAQSQMGLTSAAILASKMLFHWRPKYLVHIGIAAGLVGKPGDILFGTSSLDYASGKVEDVADEGIRFSPQGESVPVCSRLKGMAESIKASGEMLLRIRKRYPGGIPDLELHIGPYASGPYVISSAKVVQDLKSRQRKLIALDMESFAIFQAVHEAGDICKALVIKASSDKAVGKTDEYQGRAAFCAAQFGFEFIKDFMS